MHKVWHHWLCSQAKLLVVDLKILSSEWREESLRRFHRPREQHFCVPDFIFVVIVFSSSCWPFKNALSAVVTCEIKLFWNIFEIISALYFTCKQWRWLPVKENAEVISELFQCFIFHVTTSKILSKLFRQHWTCWKIFTSCTEPLKLFWKNLRRNYFGRDIDKGWNNFEVILFHV